MSSPAARRRAGPARWWTGAALLTVAVAALARTVDADLVLRTARALAADPVGLAAVVGAYALAFMVRAVVWTRVLPRLGLGHALAALHVSLAGNHLLPFRLGEALRVTSVVRRAGIPLAPAAASTAALRGADVLAVLALGAAFGPRVLSSSLGAWGWVLLAPAAGLVVGGAWWLRREGVTLPGLRVAAGAMAAWVLESAVLWQAARWAGFAITPAEAVLVTAVTIAAQAVALAPGGLGTYEAAATAAFVAVGADAGAALAAAIAAHAVKTGYALATGAVAVAVPAPGLFGRWRLARGPARPEPAAATGPAVGPVAAGPVASGPVAVGPVVLVLPAHDEEQAVGGVVRRVPPAVCGRPVRCLVIDDGSRDATADAAAAAGAQVVSFADNRGLGAAVRHGLAAATAMGAAAVAFCDADGEYAPEELGRLVGPILAGEADYVVGSRFAGEIRRMHPHRRLGNRTLTAVLRFVARRPITDGQSGYRALSAAAAADAEIVHDYNYAQVLTLDLLAKGYRYAEVPIGYAFRRTGRSFVRLSGYLRRVLPAVHAELNAPVESVLDDMGGESLPGGRPRAVVEGSV